MLIAAAVIGKVAGGAIPALWTAGSVSALTLGISLVPRAEIALVIMEQGVSLGPEAVPPDLYAGMVITILATCFAVPIILRQRLMKKSTSSVD